MATVTAPTVIVQPGFKLADRIKIQQEIVQQKQYIHVGRLTAIVFEGQRSTTGLSQSRARYANSRQIKALKDQPGMHPFSERQAVLWSSITLDWLNHKNAPVLAISRDQQDMLLPAGMTPLPWIPDPTWVPSHAQHACPKSTKDGCGGCVPPRIPQRLVGCPVVGDRVRDKITARDGHVFGVIYPILECCVLLGGAQGGFGRIRGAVGPDGTHLSLLIDDSNPERLEAYFVGGRFTFGG